MKPRDLALAIAAFAGLVVFTPLWLAFLDSASMGAQATWVAALTLPAMVALFITSWVRPAMTTPVLGLFVLAGALAVAPQIWELGELGAAVAPDGSLEEGLFALAAPLLLVAFVLALGWRHLRQVQ